jgi:hypothetical protein
MPRYIQYPTGDLGNLAVAKVGAEANYTVELTWKKAEPAAPTQLWRPRRSPS